MKCLSTFICCGWAYGCNLGLLYPWRCGQKSISTTFLGLDGFLGGTLNCYTCGGMAEELNFWKIRVRLSQMTLQCHGWCCKHLLTASHIQFRCIWSVWATSYAVDGRMGETLNCYPWSCGPRIIFLQNRPNIGAKWRCGVMVDAANPCWLTASHIHIRCIWSVWAPSYAVNGCMGATLDCYSMGVGQ